MKNWKTTTLGVISLLLAIGTLCLVLLEKATLTEAGGYLSFVMAFIVSLNSFLSKDHDKDNLTDIGFRADSIPGGGLKKEP